jgi:hypothetical protein
MGGVVSRRGELCRFLIDAKTAAVDAAEEAQRLDRWRQRVRLVVSMVESRRRWLALRSGDVSDPSYPHRPLRVDFTELHDPASPDDPLPYEVPERIWCAPTEPAPTAAEVTAVLASMREETGLLGDICAVIADFAVPQRTSVPVLPPAHARPRYPSDTGPSASFLVPCACSCDVVVGRRRLEVHRPLRGRRGRLLPAHH